MTGLPEGREGRTNLSLAVRSEVLLAQLGSVAAIVPSVLQGFAQLKSGTKKC